jgi:hypothetical protein
MLRRLLPAVLLPTVALTACSAHDRHETRPPLPSIDVSQATKVTLDRPALPPAPGAPTPRAAVEGFLQAEVHGDSARSFDLLADPIRADLGDERSWDDAQVNLPRYRSFTVTGEDPGNGSSASVETRVALDPSLDPVTGLTPGQATVRWPVVRNANGWTVQLDDAQVTPILPPDDGAGAAAKAFVDEHRACDGAVTARLLGDPAAAVALCQATGAPQLGTVGPLTEGASEEVVAAYGADATSWGRQVTLEAPVHLRIVLAPLGDQWEVIGLGAP